MSMTIVSAEKVHANAHRDAKYDWYLAYIMSTEEPSSSTITGADVLGCAPDDRFVAGSVVEHPAGMWKAFEDGEFSAKS